MLIIGSHVGFNKDSQVLGSLDEALKYGANTFMFYTGAPQNTRRCEINEDLVLECIDKCKNNNIDYSKVIVHAPYIINLASPDTDKWEFAVNFLKGEVDRCSKLKIKNMVLHPGSHTGGGIDLGIDNIIKGLKIIVKYNSDVRILLETMAGKGTEVGSNLSEIKRIIDGVNSDQIGVCLDTCHLNDSGIDINKFDEYLDLFDKEIGINKIYCVHVNDSKNEVNSHKDRHENIGFGTIGFDNLINVIYNKRLEDIPKILETPYVDKEFAPYKYEIEMIRNKVFDDELLNKIKQS